MALKTTESAPSYINVLYNNIWSASKVIADKAYDCLPSINGTSSEAQEKQDNTRIFPEVSTVKCWTYMFYDPDHIIDNIYLGNAVNAGSELTLETFKIRYILNMTTEISNYHVFKNKYKYEKYSIYDNNQESIYDYLEEAYNKIIEFQKNASDEDENEPKNILVHCYAGRSRSASVVIYYVMKKLKLCPDDAIEYVKNRRTIINPTRIFKDDLEKAYCKMKQNKIE